MKLYRVTCRGMHGGLTSDTAHGIAYVVAADAGEAYELLRQYLVDEDLGYDHDREMEKVELLAEEADYPDCGHHLLIAALAAPQDIEGEERP